MDLCGNVVSTAWRLARPILKHCWCGCVSWSVAEALGALDFAGETHVDYDDLADEFALPAS